jgi:hypothetical protein
MFQTISFVTYRSAISKPSRCVQSETISSLTMSASNSASNRFESTSNSYGYTQNETTNNTLTSLRQIIDNGEGITFYTSWNKNSSFQSISHNFGDGTSSDSSSGSQALRTVSNQTTTSVSYFTNIRSTTSTTLESQFYSTTQEENQTYKTTTFVSSKISATTSANISTELTSVGITTSNTEAFTTWTDWSEIGTVVEDTIYLSIPKRFNENGFLFLSKTLNNSENESELKKPEGIHALNFVSLPLTVQWKPPLSFEQTQTRGPYTTTVTVNASNSVNTQSVFSGGGGTNTTAAGGARTYSQESTTTRSNGTSTTSQSTTSINSTASSSSSAVSVTFGTKTFEDYTTFTTSSQAGTNTRTFSTTSFSSVIRPSYSEEEFTDEGGQNNVTTYQTATYSYSFQTNTTLETTTILSIYESRGDTTTSTLSISVPKLKEFSTTPAQRIITDAVPWIAQNYFGRTTANSLDSNTGITTERNTTFPWNTLYSTATVFISGGTTTRSGSFSNSATGFANASGSTENYRLAATINNSGTIYKTISAQITTFQNSGSCWKVGNLSVFGSDRFAASPELTFATQPTRTAAPLLLQADGQHTLVFGYDQEFAAQVTPGEIVSPLPLNFTTILSLNTDGGMNHPSKWSTMTIARNGRAISSTWAIDQVESILTQSGECGLTTSSNFPYGTFLVPGFSSTLVGGHMQPNTFIQSWAVPGVLFTQNESQSGFLTNNDYNFYIVPNDGKATVFRDIPQVAGAGVFATNILDDGMP